jgi:glycosyltransferase involved in cell wall biosynthesis
VGKKLSLVIRTLNEARHLEELITVAFEQVAAKQQGMEIIVVDSGSSDETVAIASRLGAKIVHIDRPDFSFGRSLNLGCAHASGDYFVFISGHCVPKTLHWLGQLIAPLEIGNGAYSYGRQIGAPGTRISEQRLFEKYFPDDSSRAQGHFFCNNANAAIGRQVWERYRFNENLTGLEDMELAKRLCHDGMQIAYVPEAVVSHYHDENWGQVKRRYEREAIALQKIMPEVHVSFGDALRYFAGGVLGDWAYALENGCFTRRAFECVAFRFCQFYGVWRGNHQHRKLSKARKERYFYPD